MAEIDGEFTGDAKLRLDGVESAVAPTDDSSLVEHGDLFGHGGVRVTKAAREFADRERFLEEFPENDPACGGGDGGEDAFEGRARK